MTRTTKLQRSSANLAAMLALCVTATAAAQDPAPAAQAPAQDETGGQFALRTSVQLGAGAAAQVAVWAPAILIMADVYNDCAADLSFAGPAVCPMAVGPIVGIAYGASTILTPTAVYVSGELAGGNGNFWYTLLGSASASATTVLLAPVLFDTESQTGATLGFAALMAMPIIGSVLGYELSQEGEIEEDRAEARSTFTVAPSAGVTADGQGAMLSASGTF
jgi:hypothetical protein